MALLAFGAVTLFDMVGAVHSSAFRSVYKYVVW